MGQSTEGSPPSTASPAVRSGDVDEQMCNKNINHIYKSIILAFINNHLHNSGAAKRACDYDSSTKNTSMYNVPVFTMYICTYAN